MIRKPHHSRPKDLNPRSVPNTINFLRSIESSLDLKMILVGFEEYLKQVQFFSI